VIENTIPAEKISRTSRIWGKPNGAKVVILITCDGLMIVKSQESRLGEDES